MGMKSKWLSRSEKLNVIKQLCSVPNVPHTKIAEELGIPLRKVTDRVVEHLGESSEKVLIKTAANCTNLAYICKT